MALSLSPHRAHKKLTPSPPAPGQPFLSEDVATSTALYKLATTPSPKINRPHRSPTPSPNDSRSRNVSDEEDDDLGEEQRRLEQQQEGGGDEGVSPRNVRGRRRNKKQKKDNGCVLSKGGYPEIPSGLGLGLAMPVLPNDPEEAFGEPPLVTWRFSSITKPSSIYSPTSPTSPTSPASPSPSDSVAGEDLPLPSSLSIHTLTPGPSWPPPPSTVVSPVASPMPEDFDEEEDVDVSEISVPPAAAASTGRGWSNTPETPTSPLPPNIARLLNELSSIPRPESQKSEDGQRHVTSVQAWVLDMPNVQQLRSRSRGDVKVRKMKSWRNLRAKMSMPYAPPPPPSPPITPPHDAESQQSEPEEEQEEYEDVEITEDDEPTPVPPQRATFETDDNFHFDTTDYIPYNEMPVPSPANSFEMYRDKPDDHEAVVDDVDEVQEILPRQQEAVILTPITPDPNSDLVHEIEALLRSSPIRSGVESPEISELSEQSEADEESPKAVPETRAEGTDTPSTNEDFFTPAEQTEDRQFFEDEDTTPVASVDTTPTIRQASMPSTPTVRGSWTPPMIASTGNTPRRPPLPERRSSQTRTGETSIDGRLMASYPPVAGTRPVNHRRGKSVDSSSIYNRRNMHLDRPAQRQRSSSASADNRIRSIEDGPPEIPARRSSIGKTGPSFELLPGIAQPVPPPTLITQPQRLSDIRSSSVYSQGTDRWSPIVYGGEQMAEVVAGDLMRSGSVKEVMVRSPSNGTKGKEFNKAAATPPTNDNSPRIPTIDFGGSPMLEFGSGETRADGDMDGSADPQQSSGSELPVVFQVIPPTPAAGLSRQLGIQTPQAISIPSTPAPDAKVNAEGILATPNGNLKPNGNANISKKLDPPPVPPTRTPPPDSERPRTAPERLNPDDFGSPPASPRRPSLKKLPTKFRESKLSPWWRPRRDPDSPSSSLSTARTVTSSRPGTATTATTLEGPPKKKAKTLKLGKVEVEFVGLKELRRQMKLQKEVKARRRSASLSSAGSTGKRASIGGVGVAM